VLVVQSPLTRFFFPSWMLGRLLTWPLLTRLSVTIVTLLRKLAAADRKHPYSHLISLYGLPSSFLTGNLSPSSFSYLIGVFVINGVSPNPSFFFQNASPPQRSPSGNMSLLSPLPVQVSFVFHRFEWERVLQSPTLLIVFALWYYFPFLCMKIIHFFSLLY